MRVTLETDGGFAAIPGLRRAVTVDGAALPADAQQQLASLLAHPSGLKAPAAARPLGAARDARTYVLTIDDGGRQRTVRFSDPVPEGPLRALRDFVTQHGTRGEPGA